MSTPFVLHGANAIDLQPGTWLLEASAGTGKTYTIVGIIIRLVIEADVALERCVVMTFTRAATAELRERIRSGLHRALQAIDADPAVVDDGFFRDLALAYHGDTVVRDRLLLALASPAC